MVETLAREGHDVIAADLAPAFDASPEDRTRWPEIARAAGARLMPMDLSDEESVREAVRGAEVVFHIAAVFDYTAPERLLRAVNVQGTRNLFESLIADGSCRRVVNWGAGGIYGYPAPGEVFSEDSPKSPSNPYLRSKWHQEQLAHRYRERGIEVTSIRPVSPYGPRASYGSGQLLLGLAERPPVVFRNLTGNIPMEHVEDVCAAALHLAVHREADGEAYNVTAEAELDAVRLASIVAEEVGTGVRVLPAVPLGPTRRVLSGGARVSMALARRSGKRPLLEYDQVQYFGRDWRYSNEKLRATGFELRWPDPEPGVRATLKWYMERGWIARTPAATGRG